MITTFHKNYPNLYAVAVAQDIDGLLIPNEPYTPQIDAITMDYFATTRVDNGSSLVVQKVSFGAGEEKDILEGYKTDQVQIFHQGPFGNARQHAFLKG